MTSPRRRGSRLRALLLLALPVGACGDGDEGLDPQIRAPETGTYAYDALIHTNDTLPPDTFTGALEISVSSEDTILGAWAVPGFTGAPVRGFWNITAYTLPANPSALQGTVTHRLWRANTGDLNCALTYQRITLPADTFTSAAENDCTLILAD